MLTKCRLRSSLCDSTLEELAAAWAGDAYPLEALPPLPTRSSITSLRSVPAASERSSCSTASAYALMSSGSSPYAASPSDRAYSCGAQSLAERERQLWDTRAEAVTYAAQLRSLEHLAKRVRPDTIGHSLRAACARLESKDRPRITKPRCSASDTET